SFRFLNSEHARPRSQLSCLQRYNVLLLKNADCYLWDGCPLSNRGLRPCAGQVSCGGDGASAADILSECLHDNIPGIRVFVVDKSADVELIGRVGGDGDDAVVLTRGCDHAIARE